MRDFREFKVWEKAHDLTLDVYRVTRTFPKEELYSLTSQIRRAAGSIGANIAEGAEKILVPGLRVFCKLRLARRANSSNHILLAKDLDYWRAGEFQTISAKIVETKKMLTGFLHYLSGVKGTRTTKL